MNTREGTLHLQSDAWVIAQEQAGSWAGLKPWSDPDLDTEQVVFHPSVYIDPSSTIGKGTVLFPFVFIGPNVTIGAECVIGPGACIGQPGFGYDHDDDDTKKKYRRHTFGVTIDDDVHVGANTCIDQGRHRPTRIGKGTRIDNLVHIAHNVEIGEDCLVIACSMLAGSVTVGDRAYVAPSSAVRDWINIGHDSMIGLGAVVVKDVPSGVTVKGVPAK